MSKLMINEFASRSDISVTVFRINIINGAKSSLSEGIKLTVK